MGYPSSYVFDSMTIDVTPPNEGSTFSTLSYQNRRVYCGMDGWYCTCVSELDGSDPDPLLIRVVDFGTNAQTVPVEFYDWFTANATRID